MKNLISAFIIASFIPLSFADTEIYVRGTGNVKAAPDVGFVNFAITTSNLDAMKAQTENAQIANNVIRKLKSDYKLEDKDIQTSTINVGPRYSYPTGNSRKFEGFEVNNSFTIKTRQLNDLGKLLDTLVKNGVNNIQNISFDIDDKRPLTIQALGLAYEDAKEKAEALAKKSGKKLGKIKHLNEYYGQSISPMPRLGVMKMAAQAMDSTPIHTGEEAVTASVELIYEVK